LFSFFVCVKLRIIQSACCKIHHPKMPRISKRANLFQDFEAIAKSCTIKGFVAFALMKKTALKMKFMIM